MFGCSISQTRGSASPRRGAMRLINSSYSRRQSVTNIISNNSVSAIHSLSSKFKGFYSVPSLLSDSSIVWHLCCPTSIYSEKSIFRRFYSARAIQCDNCIIRHLYRGIFLVIFLSVADVIFLSVTDAKTKGLNLLDRLIAYMNIVYQIQVILFALGGLGTMGFDYNQ